jgi:hypothetical protein
MRDKRFFFCEDKIDFGTSFIFVTECNNCQSQWPRGLRPRSTAARLVAIVCSNPTGSMDVCLFCVCCVLSGRGPCDELITRPEESYRQWRVVVCYQETSWTRRPYHALGCRARENNSSNNNNDNNNVTIKTIND